jgi:glycosyltransferase involved in cell wall biosynthesis
VDCSIIICTYNRAVSLEKTLVAFQKIVVPEELKIELIIVDNGSTDYTAKVIQNATHPCLEIVSLTESRLGKSRAQNTALKAAKGGVLLFTDDDVEPAENWIEEMCRPLLEKRCDAVAGKIILDKSLQRQWFTPMHEVWLAYIRELPDVSPQLVGASMGIHRSVFDRIGYFDEELGPGASGFGEETLVWMQMKEADLRIIPITDTYVAHYPDATRLLRSNWLETATRFGNTGAYIMHHWEHSRVRLPLVQLFFVRFKLFIRSLARWTPELDAEGCPAWEMSYIVRIAILRRWIIESRKPRNYVRHGLRKIASN